MLLTIDEKAGTMASAERPWRTADTHRPDLRGPDAPAVFAAVFDRYAPTVLRYLRLHLRAADAEDVLAETFAQAWDGRERYDPNRAVCSTWLFGIAAHLLSRHKRSWLRGERAFDRVGRQLAPSIDGHEDAVVDRLAADDVAHQLAAALSRLNDADRQVLLLTSSGELSAADIARIAGVPVGTVRSRLHRARRQLRDLPAVTALLASPGERS